MKSIYGGMAWAFTPFAKERLLELVAAGVQYDLAVAMLDTEILEGRLRETDVYELPDPEEAHETD